MSEEKSRAIERLNAEFKKRIVAIPEPQHKGKAILDGGKTAEQEVIEWAKAEMLKIDEMYG